MFSSVLMENFCIGMVTSSSVSLILADSLDEVGEDLCVGWVVRVGKGLGLGLSPLSTFEGSVSSRKGVGSSLLDNMERSFLTPVTSSLRDSLRLSRADGNKSTVRFLSGSYIEPL